MISDLLDIPATYPVVRYPRIRVELDRWDFSRKRVTETVDLTKYVQSYRFTKTIKGPMATGELSVLPQFAELHLLEFVNPMDVIRIYEFDTLKFQGFVRKIGFKGTIAEDGKPQRMVTVGLYGFGTYLMQSKIGINLAIFKEDFPIIEAATKLAEAIQNAGEENLTFRQMITILINAWFQYIEDIVDDTVQEDYIKTYVDFEDGVTTETTAGFPKEVFLFTGEEQELTLWQILEKLGEAPLNEFFFDEAPRNVHIAGKEVKLTDSKTHLIVRPTPFDGSVTNGGSTTTDRFQAMDEVVIPRNHLLGVDFNKGMEDVYSVYVCAPPLFQYNDLELIATGYAEIDEDKAKKYLYMPCKQDLYYIRTHDIDSTKLEASKQQIDNRVKETAKTLKNWFEHNDEYLSGTITYMVPSDSNCDPRIGDKIEIENLSGNFYAESVSHMWAYGKGLIANTDVTRGYNDFSEISLKDTLFRKGKHVL